MDDFSADTDGIPPATRQTVPNFYLVHDWGLLADGEDNVRVVFFARVGATLEPDRSMVAWYGDAGLSWFGPLPGREEDIAGIAISYTRFGDDFRGGTGDGMAESETALELVYRAQITRWLALNADLQFLFNTAMDPAVRARRRLCWGSARRSSFS